jgi:hypothetical protein
MQMLQVVDAIILAALGPFTDDTLDIEKPSYVWLLGFLLLDAQEG